MKMVRDDTGRFGARPHYTQMELDQEFEILIQAFLQRHHREAQFPIATDDLQVLIEEYADDLDTYADLSPHGKDLEGVTLFPPDGRPIVLISENVASDPRRENRLRTTLAHEFGHVYLHNHLWHTKHFVNRLSSVDQPEYKAICKRSTILGEGSYDWMEWQAGYASGAILMPFSLVQEIAGTRREENDFSSFIHVGSERADAIIREVVKRFTVSEEAARVRLLKLRILAEPSPDDPCFEITR